MSIYASTLSFDNEWDDDSPGAIAYHGSHIYPDPLDRRAKLGLAVIPGHIAEGGGVDPAHSHWFQACHRPFLRLDFSDPFGNDYPDRHATPTRGTLLLDAAQVEELRDNLTDFLERSSGPNCNQEDPAEVEASVASLMRTARDDA